MYGFIGFDEHRFHRQWHDSDLYILTTAAQILSRAIENKIYERELVSKTKICWNPFSAAYRTPSSRWTPLCASSPPTARPPASATGISRRASALISAPAIAPGPVSPCSRKPCRHSAACATRRSAVSGAEAGNRWRRSTVPPCLTAKAAFWAGFWSSATSPAWLAWKTPCANDATTRASSAKARKCRKSMICCTRWRT